MNYIKLTLLLANMIFSTITYTASPVQTASLEHKASAFNLPLEIQRKFDEEWRAELTARIEALALYCEGKDATDQSLDQRVRRAHNLLLYMLEEAKNPRCVQAPNGARKLAGWQEFIDRKEAQDALRSNI